MRQCILDTDTLSYVLDARYPEVNDVSRQYYRVFGYYSVTVITITEIVEGLSAVENYAGLEDFRKRLTTYEVFPVESEEANLASEILGALRRTGQGIDDLDPFIAAISIVNSRPLVTNNSVLYQRIIDLGFGLELDNWKAS